LAADKKEGRQLGGATVSSEKDQLKKKHGCQQPFQTKKTGKKKKTQAKKKKKSST